MERLDSKPVIRIFLPCKNAMNDSKYTRYILCDRQATMPNGTHKRQEMV
jgi:hypothetical protein